MRFGVSLLQRDWGGAQWAGQHARRGHAEAQGSPRKAGTPRGSVARLRQSSKGLNFKTSRSAHLGLSATASASRRGRQSSARRCTPSRPGRHRWRGRPRSCPSWGCLASLLLQGRGRRGSCCEQPAPPCGARREGAVHTPHTPRARLETHAPSLIFSSRDFRPQPIKPRAVVAAHVASISLVAVGLGG